ncbi:hypothetical protein XENTR_v10024821 [Xenopus tropicalis]|uniref:Serine/threonine-protein kinase 11-interacting protein n=1 Tax=Xenopus tropicalis TaxID=8364 RepID=F6VZR3_XENTR|nr:hypothetical protein XENTR_v10024821 [Xenopus tropicalis]KAE8581524.1 hypothetical protein XENTR_v10024821 [Xenopus tropicalis]
MPSEVPESLVQALAQILHEHGDKVLDGSRILALLTPCLQVVTRLFEQLFPRGPGTGFQALPAHPADSVPILRAQFMLDMLQKTPSLKLVHPAECPRQFDVNIFPFKSLRSLELRCLPPHCLRGLRSVYSQLEVLTCYRCVSSLEEVIALCGGDLSSALPWLVLHTLDFSYNTLKNLDGSLELLNSLKILDLSHNQITECGSYLKVLSELQYLNLGYNHLTAVPELSVGNTAKLHSLILKHNQLSGTSGLENLPNLQHLDLSYNLLLEHSQLSGLARLHNLKQLFLEGNPLYFQKDYRALTAQHLSHKASDNVLLDGKLLSSSEIMNAQAFGEKVRLQPSSSATESSCTGDLTDSYSAAEKSAPRLPRKKSRVKVRTASISERSDSEYERRGQPIVLQHQREIERTDSFREQYGEDWLQYRPHLEGELDPEYVNRPHSPPPRASPSPTAPSSVPKRKSPVPAPEPSPSPPSPKSGHVAPDDQLMEKAEEGLEEHLWGLQEAKKPNEEEGLIGGALCSPVVVCPVLNGQPRNPDWPWVFLRITLHFLLEMDPERGRILLKRELRSLRGIQTSLAPWKCNGEEQELPLLTLSFDSVCEEKQTVNYIVLDNSPESSVTTLLDLLRPMLERNLREKAESQDELTRMQCLKCKTEFRNEVDGGDIYSPESVQQGKEPTAGLHRNHTGDASCPSCGSLHIILAPLNPTGETSTPLRPLSAEPPQGDDGGGGLAAKSFYLSEDEDSSETDSSPNTAPSEAESTIFYSFDTEGQDQQSAQDTGRSSLTGSYKYTALNQSGALSQDGWQISPGPASTLDFRLVDHRLKLYLDMEVLNGDMEEFRCCMKVPVIRFGKVSEFWAVVAVSNQKIYFLEITGEIRDNPSDWLQPIESQSLTSLARLHVGLQEHSLHLGFGGSGGAYTLLTRNQQHCRVFHKHMLDVLAELPARYLGNIQQSSEEPITPQHRLWPFLQDKVGAPESNAPPRFLYVPLFFLREDIVSPNADSPCANANSQLPLLNTASPAALIQGAAAAAPLSLLVTRTHMYLLEEDHQWLPDTPDTELPDSVQMKEKQPISNISSVHLFQSATLHLRIHLYNETQQNESAWLLWTEDPDMTREIVEWLREPWEAEYHIHFNPVTHNT